MLSCRSNVHLPPSPTPHPFELALKSPLVLEILPSLGGARVRIQTGLGLLFLLIGQADLSVKGDGDMNGVPDRFSLGCVAGGLRVKVFFVPDLSNHGIVGPIWLVEMLDGKTAQCQAEGCELVPSLVRVV